MSKDQQLIFRHRVSTTAVIEFDEEQLRALDGLTGYSMGGFLKAFYKEMGEHYLKPHEAGLRSAFKRIRETVPVALEHLDEMRNLLIARERARQDGKAYGAYTPPLRPQRAIVEGDL
jgi:hypothetical protein